jgi:hypothetical protein
VRDGDVVVVVQEETKDGAIVRTINIKSTGSGRSRLPVLVPVRGDAWYAMVRLVVMVIDSNHH